jgi:pantoate kinase
MKFSAHTALKGVTVFDPIILNEPVSAGVVGAGVVVVTEVEVGVDAVLQPVKTRERTSISARGKSHFFTDLFKLFFSFYSFFF